jgi:hypothetical protein
VSTISGCTGKEGNPVVLDALGKMLSGSLVVVAAGVVAFPVSVAVTLGETAEVAVR